MLRLVGQQFAFVLVAYEAGKNASHAEPLCHLPEFSSGSGVHKIVQSVPWHLLGV